MLTGEPDAGNLHVRFGGRGGANQCVIPTPYPAGPVTAADYPVFFSPEQEIRIGHNRLPHWDQQGRTYTITFRLADSIPESLRLQLEARQKAWCIEHPEPWNQATQLEYHKRFTAQLDLWMDEGHGSCVLRQPACARLLSETLCFFEGHRTRLYSWVIMPNHVHVLTGMLEQHQLPSLMESWKGYSARHLNQHLGRRGTLWQKGYYDRIIRGWNHFGNVVRYLRRNPAKAQLHPGEYLAWESPLAKQF